jgi:hypothetical protein
MHTLTHYKQIVEQDFNKRGEPIPEGFAITYNEETQLVKVFLDADSFSSLKDPQDVIMAQWNGKEWEDK